MGRLIFGLLASIALSAAQAQEVQKPVYAVGDWCEYGLDGIGMSKQRREVVKVGPDGGYTLKFTDDQGEHLRAFNSDGRMIQIRDEVRNFISNSGPVYPINASKRGNASKYSRPHSRRPGVIVEVTQEVRSVGSEKITVPVGTFDTLRVELVSNYRYQDGSYANQFVDTIWYALDTNVKFPVKLAYVDYGSQNSAITRLLAACGSAQPGK